MGKIIIIEGIDAVGKSTVAKCVCEKMKSKKVDCVCLSKKTPIFSEETNPYVLNYAESLRKMVWTQEIDGNTLDFLTESGWVFQLALWYVFIQENYVRVEASKHDMVIIDGWFYKMYARMLQNRNKNVDLLKSILQVLSIGDMIFLLHEKPEICSERRILFKDTEVSCYGEKIVGSGKEAFIEFQGKVQDVLEKLAEENGWFVLKCEERTAEEIAVELVEKYIKEETWILRD